LYERSEPVVQLQTAGGRQTLALAREQDDRAQIAFCLFEIGALDYFASDFRRL